MENLLPYIVVQVAVENEEQAARIAMAVVEKKLAACAQIFPIKSTYEWKNNIVQDSEWLIFMKTRKEVFDELQAYVKELHSYEVPEILAIPVVAGSSSYLSWIDGCLLAGKPKR